MIIGITGTVGAGKGAVVNYLTRKKGFKHYSARAFLTREMEQDGITINRDTMIDYANVLREKNGADYIFTTLCKEAEATGGDAIIESIRTIGEAETLKQRGGVLLAVDADIEKRYTRIHGRGSALDQVTFEEFKVQDAREMTSDDPHKQNISAVMRMADCTIQNNGTVGELRSKIEEFINKKLEHKN